MTAQVENPLTWSQQPDAPVDLEGWSRLAWRADIAASLACASVGGAEAMPSAEILDRHIMANKRANDGIS